MTKQLIIYVSGAPGSGKTTLARLISEQLYLPNVSSDLIHGGVAFSHPEHSREQTLKEVFVPTMIDMAQKRISFVVDHVLQKGLSEADIVDRLRPHATIVNVHTQSTDPIGRYIDRVNSSEIPSIIERREHLLGLAKPHRDKLGRTSPPLELGLPVITVNTDAGYLPEIKEIIEFIVTVQNS